MPTSDADRHTALLQEYLDLAVGVRAIREAVERAFDVTLPSEAPTMKGELKIIARAIYTIAERSRTYRIDVWTGDGESIVEHLAAVENLIVARAAYRAACERWPNSVITLRPGARVIEDTGAGGQRRE
jgi:hypothetical protein